MKQLLADLGDAERHLRRRAERIPGLLAHADALARLQALASVRPRVILVGESNVGKTSIANLLLGQAVLPDSVITNTRRPLVLHHSATVGVVTGGVWAASALTCTITPGNTSCTSTGSVSITAAQSINLQVVANGNHAGTWSLSYSQP